MKSAAPQTTWKMPAQRRRKALGEKLLQWFATARRPLPWRGKYEPYAVWISEMMLQQTQVETMLPYFGRWMKRFPTVEAVASAPQQAVLKAWEGLGYYSRARSLHRAARQIMKEHGGELPRCAGELQALPGIGPYTAGAISSIAFNRDAPAVDGNIARVLSRLFALEEPVNHPAGRKRLWELARAMLPKGQARDFNQGLMELGALICRARSPACTACPLRPHCTAGKAGKAEEYPRKSARVERRQLRGVMLLPTMGGRLLMRRRPAKGLWGGLWEFPWLELEAGESRSNALQRLIAQLNLGVDTAPRSLGRISHGLTHMQLELQCYQADAIDGEDALPPTEKGAPAGGARRWVTPAARKRLPLARLSHKALELWECARQGLHGSVTQTVTQAATQPAARPAARPTAKSGGVGKSVEMG